MHSRFEFMPRPNSKLPQVLARPSSVQLTQAGWPCALIVLAFVISRLLYYWAGIRFDVHILTSNFQFIDLQLLRTKMLESVFYFHMQPPLMNILVGAALKAFPENYGTALHVLYLVAGLSSAILLFIAMTRLGVSKWMSTALAILFFTSPASILYENFPMYEYLIMWLLLASGVVLYQLIEQPSFPNALGFFSLLAVLAWIRSLYHLLYLVGMAAVLAFCLKRHRKFIILGSIVPILAVLALFVKNFMVFGLFASSSWLGHSLTSCTTHQLTDEEKDNLIRQGKLDPIGRIESGANVADYHPFFPDVKPTGIAVLDQEVKSTGELNTNNIYYLKADLAYRRTSKQVLLNYPIAYLRSEAIAWFAYFRPPTDFFQFTDRRTPIRAFDRLYNLIFFGQLREASNKDLRRIKSEGRALSLPLYTGVFLIIGFPLLLIAGVLLLIRGIRFGTLSAAQLGLLAFVIFNIVYIIATTNFLASFENNRYAFPSYPLYAALLGFCLHRFWPDAFSRRPK